MGAARVIGPPAIATAGRVWSSDEVAHLAWRWRATTLADLADWTDPVALVMTNEPESVALFFALSTLPSPLVLLPPDRVAWRTSPPIPPGTPLCLLPSQAEWAPDAAAFGMRARIVDGAASAAHGASPAFLQTPGFVLFTSGSTGEPKAIFRSTASAIDSARQRAAAFGLGADSHVIASLPLDRPAAVQQTLMPSLLGSRLALVHPADYKALLRAFASGDSVYWTCTPALADVLTRAVEAPHPAPAICLAAGHVSARLFDAFLDRFGVPLRGFYGSSEAQWVAIDTRPAGDVRPGVVGRPAPQIALRIGDRPDEPVDVGATGRLWIKSPWLTAGYGFPPALEALDTIDGWWGTPDVGSLDAGAVLTVIGRLDDTVRTGAGQLVNLGHVAATLTDCVGVRDAVVVPLESETGVVIAALAEVDRGVRVEDLRNQLARTLPAAVLPRILETTDALPRLADGRPDRRQCIARLAASV